MEFLKRAKVFRLKCEHHDKYLAADEDELGVKQSSQTESTRTRWMMELVEGKSNVIRLRSCHGWKYLTATDESFLTGQTGNKAVLRLRLDSSVEWEPIKVGQYIKLKSHVGTFLRANRGTYPWRGTVTHDKPGHWTAKEDMLLWIVDIVERHPVSNDVPLPSDSQSIEDYDEESDSSESFGRLRSMLAALEDDVDGTSGE